jgi:hypothetical protein
VEPFCSSKAGFGVKETAISEIIQITSMSGPLSSILEKHGGARPSPSRELTHLIECGGNFILGDR